MDEGQLLKSMEDAPVLGKRRSRKPGGKTLVKEIWKVGAGIKMEDVQDQGEERN